LSVLIPCFNAGAYLEPCLESVKAELDGSCNRAGHALQRAGRVVTQHRRGASAARNRALHEASGSLVVWLDADDLLVPGTLARRRQIFEQEPGLQMLVGQYEVFWDFAPSRTEIWPQPPCDATYLESGVLSRRNLPHLNAMTFRRDAVRALGGFDTSLGTSEDIDFWLRAWMALTWRFEPGIQARQRMGTYPSASRRPGRVRNYRNQGLVLSRNRRRLRTHFGTDAPWRKAYAAWTTDFAEVQLQNHRRVAAMRGAAEAAMRTRSTRAIKLFAEAAAPRMYDWASRLRKRVVT
jgi:glycosyltransferase involved in cell wall biosynthesis